MTPIPWGPKPTRSPLAYSGRFCLLLLAVFSTLCLSSQARGDDGFDLQQFNPAPNQSGDFFSATSSHIAPHLHWQLSALLNYANSPLVLRDSSGKKIESIITSQSTLNILGSIGLLDMVELGIDIPLVTIHGNENTRVQELDIQDSAYGVGDLRLVPKVQLFDTRSSPQRPGIGMALVGDLFLPTGNASTYSGGDLRGAGKLALDLTIPGGTRFAANLGYLLRRNTNLLNVEVTDALIWALATDHHLTNAVQIVGELFGKAGVAAAELGSEEIPMELLVGARYRQGDLMFQAGGGTGIVNGFGTPDFRLFIGFSFVPKGRDYLDHSKHTEPEPIPPQPQPQPQSTEPNKEKPGTERTATIDRRRGQIITENILFEVDSDVIDRASYWIIDQVFTICQDHPDLYLRIEGHTDSTGASDHNMRLSERRANSVRRYLVEKGINPARLTSRGHGPRRPIADNESVEGKAENRRVEFHIVK